MTTPARCPRCGATLPPETAPESCPKCLVQVGLDRTEPGADAETSVRTHGRPAPDPSELAADFPQLEILELLGQGGMGAVYKARQKSLDRLVALKILNVPEGAGPDFAERFSREARALASLAHPSIVTVYDSGRSGDRYFLLMEYVDGANLHRLIHDGGIEPHQALELVSHLCEALQFAHESGVVHRDIKPENILVDKKGRVKIADFGLAKILGRAADPTRLTGARQVMGTAHYMAPEQLERPLEVDHRADIYSLGVVFYELLTGELPIGRFQPPSRKIEVDVRIDDVVLKTLEKEPRLRYQHATDVKTAIDGIQGSVDSAPRVATVPTGHPWLPWAIAIVVTLVLGAFGAMFIRLDRRIDGGAESVTVTTRNPWGESGATVESSSANRDAPAQDPLPMPTPPLTIAASRGQERIASSLLEAGADVNAVDRQGTTALSAAVDGGHGEIVRMLLDRNADPSAARQSGVTPLMIAAARGDRLLAQMLLDAGAQVDATDRNATTALSSAVDGGHVDIVRLLLDRDADVNVARQSGVTPLMIAAARGDMSLVEALLEAGADTSAVDRRGATALSAAVDGSHEAIVERLIAADQG